VYLDNVLDMNNVVDWVLVELRTGTPDLINTGTTVEATQAAILLKDGSIEYVHCKCQYRCCLVLC